MIIFSQTLLKNNRNYLKNQPTNKKPEMSNIVSSPLGLIHLISAIIALIAGMIVISNKKGTAFHKKVGYLYVFSMLVLNITALFIYRLTGGFNLFHIFVLASLFSIVGGMSAPLFNRKNKNWIITHLEVMSWSVVGLYAAFAAEISVRLVSPKYFWIAVFLSGGLLTTFGGIFIKRRKKQELSNL